MRVPAKFGEILENGSIKCHLCPLECAIAPGQVGVCRFRANIASKFYLTNYADAAELALEDIEKKPLLHFYPGSKVISIGTNGCNMGCTFCQNWEVSQDTHSTKNLSPEDLVTAISNSEAIGVCYTYNEPFVWYEYLEASAKEVKKAGFKVIVNTNGLINPSPLRKILPLIDALNLDIKGFSDDYYMSICKAPLAPILETAKILKQEGKHFEISHLIIPGENDDECIPLGRWMIDHLGPFTPIHLNAYYPRFKMTRAATPENLVTDMCSAYRQMGFHYVYPGNVLHKHHTICFSCGSILIERSILQKALVKARNGRCPSCGEYNFIIQ